MGQAADSISCSRSSSYPVPSQLGEAPVQAHGVVCEQQLGLLHQQLYLAVVESCGLHALQTKRSPHSCDGLVAVQVGCTATDQAEGMLNVLELQLPVKLW